MCYPDRFHDCQTHHPFDDISREICPPWVIGLDVELGDIAIAIAKVGGHSIDPSVP